MIKDVMRMLYYLENTKLTDCRTCGHSCYKPRTGRGRNLVPHKKIRYFPITSRLQRLFMSSKTVKHMTWHHSYDTMDKVIVHSFNGEAWKHFNNMHPQLLVESRNMHLGLCILDSIHSGYLLLPILVSRLYSRFTTCYWGCIWGYSSCFYLWSYLVLIV
jgi:hypothetical protein